MICNRLRPLEPNTDRHKSFGILELNKKLGKTLYYVGENDTSDRSNTTIFYVYDTDMYDKPCQVANYIPLAYSKPKYPTPIATASMRIGDNYAIIDNIYVGRSYRRKGIGSSICNLCEEISSYAGVKNLYVSKNLHGDYDQIQEIRNTYSNVNAFKYLYDKLTGYDYNKTRNRINQHFLEKNGFYADYHPLHLAIKSELNKFDYLDNNTGKTSDNFRFKTQDLIDVLQSNNEKNME